MYKRQNFYIGHSETDRGAVFLTNGIVDVTNGIYVGYLGNGNLTIANGATWRHWGGTFFIVCNEVRSGTLPQTNILTVTGSGSFMSVGNRLYVGPNLPATNHYGGVHVLDGGRLELPGNVYFSSHSELRVDGTNSLVISNSPSTSLWMRYGTNGSAPAILVTRGATIDVAVVQTSTSSGGHLLVDGTGSHIKTSSDISLGGSSSGSSGDVEATIRNGGSTRSGSFNNWHQSALTLDDGRIDVANYAYQIGALRGNGTLSAGTRLANAGTIDPGADGVAGQLVFLTPTFRNYWDGHFFISGGGTLVFDLGGTNGVLDSDNMTFSGNVLLTSGTGLNGAITVDLMNGFTPKDGDTFDILTATGTITPADLTDVVFTMPEAKRTTWSQAVVTIPGGQALRLTAHVVPPDGTLLQIR